MVGYDDANLIGLKQIEDLLKTKEDVMYNVTGKGAAGSLPQTHDQ